MRSMATLHLSLRGYRLTMILSGSIKSFEFSHWASCLESAGSRDLLDGVES